MEDFLKDRRTKIKLSEYISGWIKIPTDISQGSPLSPILYLFYNADLLDICNATGIKCMATGWIDDINIITTGSTARINTEILTRIHAKAMDWAKRHAAVFAPVKYELIHFTNAPDKHKCNASLKLFEHDDIKPTKACRFLGIYLDSQLNWGAHLQHIQAQLIKRFGALDSIAGFTWGFGTLDLRRLYIATVLPQILHGCSA